MEVNSLFTRGVFEILVVHRALRRFSTLKTAKQGDFLKMPSQCHLLSIVYIEMHVLLTIRARLLGRE